MKNILLFIFIFSLLSVNAQKRYHKNKSKTTKQSIVKKDTLVVSLSFTVSFISKGSGIDKVAFNAFKKSIETHDSLNGCKLKYQIKNWGREGEKDFYFPSQSTKKYNEFIKETEKIFGKNNRIRIKRNKQFSD
jgi:hypothetical protein